MQQSNHQIRFFYNRIAPIYWLIDFFLKKKKVKLIAKINSEEKGDLLDIGVGLGTHIPYFKHHNIQAIDLSEKMLLKAKQKKQYTPVKFQQMDGEQLEFPDNSFDFVLISHVLSVTPNPNLMISEVKRVLKENGKLYILNHNTPNNLLKYGDQLFQFFSKYFHFSSYFRVKDVETLQQFELLKEAKLDPFAYTKLFVFQK